jgi:hypothetical protein
MHEDNFDDYEHGFYCADCSESYPSLFMVHDWLWQKYGQGDAVLCLGCFEARLGRDVVQEDLTAVPVNKGWDGCIPFATGGEERKTISAWLREIAPRQPTNDGTLLCLTLADQIEDREHRTRKAFLREALNPLVKPQTGTLNSPRLTD